MKKGYDNKTLDQIGKRLFDGKPLAAGEIDEIVGKPAMFSLVKERIAADQAAALVELRRTSPVRRYVFAYSGMALTALIAVGAINFYTPETALKVPIPAVDIKLPDAVPVVAGIEVPPQPTTGKLSAVPAAKSESKNEFKVERAILTRTVPASRPRRDAEPDTHFIPVSYTGDLGETSGGGQVIRVEMKRSSLFALGVDIPLENDDAVVKADLLIGRDGVTRAVRMVD